MLLHGVPTSSFLWRHVLEELAARGLHGVAFDLPGLGLADRPADYDYSWTGLGRFSAAAVDELGIDSFHLVVHDIGGPVGFELLASVGRDRVRSLTVMNTMVEVDTFERPWMMEPFAHRGVGEAWLASTVPPLWYGLMRWVGGRVPYQACLAHLDLLKRDRGCAFLRMMRSFERTREKRDLYVGALRSLERPAQVVWGGADPALPPDPLAEYAVRALGGAPLHVLPRARHFPQEDQAGDVAELVARLVRSAESA